VSRNGDVEYVMVGDALRIQLPDFKRVRGGTGRFRGLRCIHTHLRGESLTRDDLTDLALLRLDAMVAIQVDEAGLPKLAEYASLRPPDASGETVEVYTPLPPSRFDFDFLEWIEALEDRFAEGQRGIHVDGAQDRAILVGVALGPDPRNASQRCVSSRARRVWRFSIRFGSNEPAQIRVISSGEASFRSWLCAPGSSARIS
jgi:GTP-binding protein HflX